MHKKEIGEKTRITYKIRESPVAGDEAFVVGDGALVVTGNIGCVAGDSISLSVVDNTYGERNRLQKAVDEDGVIYDYL